jgi:hypothetical protein
MEAQLAGKGESLLFGEDAGVAELLHVLDSWHVLHHLLIAEQLQGLEVEEPKMLMPSSGVVIVASLSFLFFSPFFLKDSLKCAPSGMLSKNKP